MHYAEVWMQFLLEVPPAPAGDIEVNGMALVLAQEDVRFTPDEGNKANFSISLKLYPCPDPEAPKRMTRLVKDIRSTGNYVPIRSATMTAMLTPGKYILIASTFKAGQETKLSIEASARWPVHISELKE